MWNKHNFSSRSSSGLPTSRGPANGRILNAHTRQRGLTSTAALQTPVSACVSCGQACPPASRLPCHAPTLSYLSRPSVLVCRSRGAGELFIQEPSGKPQSFPGYGAARERLADLRREGEGVSNRRGFIFISPISRSGS